VKTILLGIVAALIGTALIWLVGGETHPYSFWWLTPIIGLALGFTIKPVPFAIVLALFSGGLGWGLPLLYRSTDTAIGNVASVVASIVGIGNANGWIIIAVTILLGTLLCASSAWTGMTLRQGLGFTLKAM
jgi:hypothetical protein